MLCCHTRLDRVSGFPIGVGNDYCYIVLDDCVLVVGNDVMNLGSFAGGEFRLRISLNKRCISLVQS